MGSPKLYDTGPVRSGPVRVLYPTHGVSTTKAVLEGFSSSTSILPVYRTLLLSLKRRSLPDWGCGRKESHTMLTQSHYLRRGNECIHNSPYNIHVRRRFISTGVLWCTVLCMSVPGCYMHHQDHVMQNCIPV
jgi:hypothetical protein